MAGREGGEGVPEGKNNLGFPCNLPWNMKTGYNRFAVFDISAFEPVLAEGQGHPLCSCPLDGIWKVDASFQFWTSFLFRSLLWHHPTYLGPTFLTPTFVDYTWQLLANPRHTYLSLMVSDVGEVHGIFDDL